MDLNRKILSDIVVYSKYARFLPEKNRRETWDEIVTRNMEMHIRKYPQLEEEIKSAYEFVYRKEVLPSMRSLQFGGRPIEANPARIYNCSFLHVDDYRAFSEAMFLLLCGTGVGYSVQNHHIEKLPPIRRPLKKRRYLISDSIEGWADSVKALMKAYMCGTSLPIFDFSDIRQKGALLITSGGKAPGPEPLKECLFHIQKILDRKSDGEVLTSLECHDIFCYIADAVLAGGIRRSAMIALFDMDDQDMLTSKFGDWYIENPQRGRANNSVVLVRHKMKNRVDFDKIFNAVKESGAGEPGIFWTNSKDLGTNPSLRAGTRVLTHQGIYPIEKLAERSFMVRNLNGESSVARCFQSGRGKQLYKITLSGGHEYYCTPEHKWPVLKDGKYSKTLTTEMMVGDVLPVNRSYSLFFDSHRGSYSDGQSAAEYLDCDGIFISSENYRKGFLSKLFSSRINVGKEFFLPTNKTYANDISDLLGFYGVQNSISERDGGYYLSISDEDSLVHFRNIVNDKTDDVPKNGTTTVVGIEITNNYEDVWDITVYDDTHCFQLAHVITGNCGEISLHTNQFCNLCEVNASDIRDQEDYEARVKAAAFIGTLQTSYTDFHYLRDVWKKTTEKEALLGIGMTGVASGVVQKLDMSAAARVAAIENERVAKLINVNCAARITTLKPSGTSSLVVGSSSGVHAWHNDFYIRRMRLGKNESIYQYLLESHPELLEDEYFKPHLQAVVSIPIKAPEGAILRTESPIDTLERVKDLHTNWITPGHRKGQNTHNVSCTISVKEDEWGAVGEWMWKNREFYTGISVLPYDGGSYIQAPHEDCSEEEYLRLTAMLKDIDLSNIVEVEDVTDLSGELACAGGACSIEDLTSKT